MEFTPELAATAATDVDVCDGLVLLKALSAVLHTASKVSLLKGWSEMATFTEEGRALFQNPATVLWQQQPLNSLSQRSFTKALANWLGMPVSTLEQALSKPASSA